MRIVTWTAALLISGLTVAFSCAGADRRECGGTAVICFGESGTSNAGIAGVEME